MLQWVCVAANAAAWRIEAHTPLAAVLTLSCKSEWTGRVLLQMKCGHLTVIGRIARKGVVLEVFTGKHQGSDPASWLFKNLRRHYDGMRIARHAPHCLLGRPLVSDLIVSVGRMAATEKDELEPTVRRGAPDLWLVQMERVTHVLVFNSSMLKQTSRQRSSTYAIKGYNGSKTPPWDRFIDVGSLAHWMYRQLAEIT